MTCANQSFVLSQIARAERETAQALNEKVKGMSLRDRELVASNWLPPDPPKPDPEPSVWAVLSYAVRRRFCRGKT